MRLIDGDVLIEKFNEKADMAECLIDERTAERFATFCALADAVEESPTVDAVPVVRCKDCKHCRELNRKDRIEEAYADGVLWCTNQSDGVWPDDYCSYGERRGGGEDG